MINNKIMSIKVVVNNFISPASTKFLVIQNYSFDGTLFSFFVTKNTVAAISQFDSKYS